MPLARFLPVFAVLSLLAACDNPPSTVDLGEPPTEPPPPGNRAPTAVIAPTAASLSAGQPLALDGRGSSDPDGDRITLHWDFGDGQHGGGAQLGHVFAAAGRYTVTLTATDARGAVGRGSRVVEVGAPPAPLREQVVAGRVLGLDGEPLSGVAVSAGGLTAVSDEDGRLSLRLGIGVPQTLQFRRSGLVDQVQTFSFPTDSGSDAAFAAVMRASEPAQTLPDAAAGGTLTGRDGARIQLPPGALRTTAGTPVTGAVQIAMTPIDITLPNAGGFPGQFAGVDANAVVQTIVSYGTTDFLLSQGGQRLQLAPGKPAEILLPMYASRRLGSGTVVVGDRIPLWSLSETTGLWVQEGEGEVVASAAAPTGLALRATVSHFSPWNVDQPIPRRMPPVRGRCVYDDDIGVPGARDQFATATLCNWLAEMDRGIPPQGARAKAEPPLPPLPGFAYAEALPVGGQLLPLPANSPIRFSVTALNGSFTGSATLAADSDQTEVVVKMRRLQSSGGEAEAISLPFEAERTVQNGQTLGFRFDSPGMRHLRVTVTPTGSGNPVQGELRVFRNGSPIAGRAQLQPALTVLLPQTGEHRVELVPTASTPGTVRVRIELAGSVIEETPALPLSLARSLPEFGVLSLRFGAEAARTLFLSLRDNQVQYRLRRPDGSEVFNFAGDGDSGSFRFLPRSLPAVAGDYRLEVASLSGAEWPINLSAEMSRWLPQGAELDGHHLLDLVADREGRPVLLLSRDTNVGGNARLALALQRWTGSEWQAVGPELAGILPRNCGFPEATAAALAFDSDNRPLLVHTEALSEASGAAGERVLIRRLEAGAWQPLGPDEGRVPAAEAGSPACRTARVLLKIDSQDRPLVARRSLASGDRVEVARLDGAAWQALGAPIQMDNDAASGHHFDLQLAADGQPHLVHGRRATQSEAVAGRVLRFVATPAPGSWQPLGADQGALPLPAGQTGGYEPQLRFDAGGAPRVIASNNGAVLRFAYDGTRWTAGTPKTIVGATVRRGLGVALFGGDLALALSKLETVESRLVNTPLVQGVDAADRYTAFGPDDGAIPQFTPKGGRYVVNSGRRQRLLAIDGLLYQAIESHSSDGSTARGVVSLLRYTP